MKCGTQRLKEKFWQANLIGKDFRITTYYLNTKQYSQGYFLLFRHCFLLSRTVCIIIKYAVILPKVEGRAHCGVFSFSYAEHAGRKV